MEKKFHYASTEGRLGMSKEALATHWEHAIPVYRNAPHVWNVGGQDNVASFLLDTGEGLILIDTGLCPETLYLLIDRIWRSGHDPKDIKKIFLTHWHGDHSCCARVLHEMTGAEIWLSKEDEAEHQKHAEDTFPAYVTPYTVTNFYDMEHPLTMGRFTITFRLCPGHTPGVTSFFFEDTDEKTGKTYRCALHGGLGVGQMSKEGVIKTGTDPELPHRFIKDCYELAKMPVDIALASHLNQNNILPNTPKAPDDYPVFVADYAWADVLINRAEAVKKFYPEIYGTSGQ